MRKSITFVDKTIKMNRTIRTAQLTDMPEIMKAMTAAKEIMRHSGNAHQWGEGYPSEAVIASDMDRPITTNDV